jgi:hypothetical protein
MMRGRLIAPRSKNGRSLLSARMIDLESFAERLVLLAKLGWATFEIKLQ